jgi:adenine-specific DNA methylase
VPALKLCLTAASGQTTKMVFAVTGRGKTTGQRSEKVEVGSWVIGYWRPKLHFEVNVWNCFEKRTRELLKAVNESDGLTKAVISDDVSSVISGAADAFLACGDCRSLLSLLPEDSVQLVVTDPPHSDRIPYLELSEFWNSILGASVDFEREIVISNAKERNKTPDAYRAAMLEFLGRVQRVLSPSGILVVLFNSREEREWDAFRAACGRRQTGDRGLLQYLGHFPCRYSAGSVVQDNRKGSLKHDLALVFVRSDLGLSNHAGLSRLRRIAGWSCELPCKLGPMGAT